MPKTLIGSAIEGTTPAATPRFLAWLSGSDMTQAYATEAQATFTSDIAGTFSMLTVNVSATGTTRVNRFRKNGANGNQVLTLTDSPGGYFTDSVNTDVIAVADTFSLNNTQVTNPIYFCRTGVFAAASGHATFYGSANTTSNTVSGTRYVSLNGVGINATEANTQFKVRAPGTIQNLQLYASVNTKANDTIITSRINSVDANLTITVGAGLTGLFRDTTHSDTLADGDLACYEQVTTDAGTLTTLLWGQTFISSGVTNDLVEVFSSASRTASATVHYFCPFGRCVNISDTTENEVTIQHGFAATVSNLRVRLVTNTYTSDATIMLRKNGADVTQTLTITSGVTGYFEDTTHTDLFDPTDTLSCSIVGGTANTINISFAGITELETGTVIVAAPIRGLSLSNFGYRSAMVGY